MVNSQLSPNANSLLQPSPKKLTFHSLTSACHRDVAECLQMRIFRAFVATIACLLLLGGCGASNTTTPSLDHRQGKSILDATGSIAANTIMSRRPGDSENSKQDELGQQNYRQADFGLDDAGVIVIRADQGGNINSYERKYFAAANDNVRWVVDGYCNSACTMVLGTGRVCATPRAQFGFHAGYAHYALLFKVAVPQFTYQMYRHYPDDVKYWVDRHRAMNQLTITMMRQPEVSSYVPSCRV